MPWRCCTTPGPNTSWPPLAVCFADRFVAAYRWLVLLRVRNPNVRCTTTLRFIFISNVVGMFLPGGLEVVRIIGLWRAIGDLALSFTSVFVERMIGISTLLLIVLIGLIAGPPGLSPALGYWAVLGLALLVLGAGVLMSQRLRNMTGRLMTGRLLRPIWTRMVKLYGHLDAYALQPKLLGWSMVLAVTIHAVRIVYTTAAAWALGIDVALVTLIVLVPIVFFVAQLPISVGGLGVREMTFVSLLGLAGVGIDAAFTLSLLLYVMRILSCLRAVLYYLAAPARYPETTSSAEQNSAQVDLSTRRLSLRVLFVKDTLGHAGKDISGGVVYLLETLPRLEKPIVPSLCVLRSHHPMAARFEALGIRPLFLARAKWDPRVLTDLLSLLRREDIDLLHIEGRKSLLFGRIAARLARRPVVAHFHDMLPIGAGMRAVQRRLAPSTDLGLTVSRAVREFVVREFALPADRVEVLHNGHDLDRYAIPSADAPRLRAQLGLSAAAPLVGLIARVVNPIKGQDLMIRAMPRLLKRYPDAVLLVVGDGTDRAACEALARRLGIERSVRFLGQRDDVPDLLAAFDVVAMPSLSEGFGYAALEAAAAGRPVVAFRTGGIPEIVVDGESGLLVPTGDIEGLADELARVLSDRDLASALGLGGRRRARQFTLERHAQRLAEIYAAVAQRHELRESAPAGSADPMGEDLDRISAVDRDTEDARR